MDEKITEKKKAFRKCHGEWRERFMTDTHINEPLMAFPRQNGQIEGQIKIIFNVISSPPPQFY